MQTNGKVNNEKYAAHVLECAEIARRVGEALGLREDAARQACFATVCIDAKGHGVFLEPVPKDSKIPVSVPEAAVTAGGIDAVAAAKADAQIADVPKVTTPEQSNGARRTAFLAGIESARNLLNKEGHTPPITPVGLNAIIKQQFPGREQVGSLDIDELETLTMMLSQKLDEIRKRKESEADAPF